MYLILQTLLLLGAAFNTVFFSIAVVAAFRATTINENLVMFMLVYAVPMILCMASFNINRKSTKRRRMTILVTDVTKMARAIKDERETSVT